MCLLEKNVNGSVQDNTAAAQNCNLATKLILVYIKKQLEVLTRAPQISRLVHQGYSMLLELVLQRVDDGFVENRTCLDLQPTGRTSSWFWVVTERMNSEMQAAEMSLLCGMSGLSLFIHPEDLDLEERGGI